jgi:CheY-like chemotaxis protein
MIDILLVEDNPEDVKLTQEALVDTGIPARLRTLMDGAQAMDYVNKQGDYADEPTPDVVFLDLNLPKRNGHAVLEELRRNVNWVSIPVVVLTVSRQQEEIVHALDNGMNFYMNKPVEPVKLASILNMVIEFWIKEKAS